MKDHTEKMLYGKSFTDFSTFVADFRKVTSIQSMEAYEQLLATDSLVVIDFYATWCPPCA
jgi:thiol-disulfide isomerase/thioredoxin